jgi:hypothetical protein
MVLSNQDLGDGATCGLRSSPERKERALVVHIKLEVAGKVAK